MKASELMIMDWVLLDGTPIQVAGLHNRKVGVHKRRRSIYCSWHSDGEFRPIPLTEDILTKNGFLKRSGKEYYLKDDIVIFVGSDSCEVCTLYGEYTAYSYVEEGYTTIATIHYIHQLQHLLRLCDIEKEIEL